MSEKAEWNLTRRKIRSYLYNIVIGNCKSPKIVDYQAWSQENRDTHKIITSNSHKGRVEPDSEDGWDMTKMITIISEEGCVEPDLKEDGTCPKW